jgi:hypothetical protein
MDSDHAFLIVLFAFVAGECFLCRFKSQIRRGGMRSTDTEKMPRPCNILWSNSIGRLDILPMFLYHAIP